MGGRKRTEKGKKRKGNEMGKRNGEKATDTKEKERIEAEETKTKTRKRRGRDGGNRWQPAVQK